MTKRVHRRRHDGRAGQSLVVLSLCLPVMLAFAVLAVDAGFNYVDRRALQSAADVGALAGAPLVGSDATGAAALKAAQIYAWRDLRQAVPAAATACASSPCTVTSGTWPNAGAYQVTAKTPVPAGDLTNSTYAAAGSEEVEVEIHHANAQVGFAGVIGMGTVQVGAKAVALAKPGKHAFPFALATRYLNLTGNAAVVTAGAALIGQCDDGGKGDASFNSHNGGIAFGGNQSGLFVGPVWASQTDTNSTSAQAILVQDPGSVASCSAAGNANGLAPMGNNQDLVQFDNSLPTWNDVYGFDAGSDTLSGCVPAGAPTECASPFGVASAWMDSSCWTAAGKTVAAGTYTQPYWPGESTAAFNAGTAVGCTASPTYEGTFPSGFTLPDYMSPLDLLLVNGIPVQTSPQPSNGGSQLNAGNGGKTIAPDPTSGGVYYTSTNVQSGANLSFNPGWYVFDGPGASISLGNGGGWNCTAGAITLSGSPTAFSGCVFIFENGANFTIASSASKNQAAAVHCDGGNGYGACALQFSTTSTATPPTTPPGLLSFTNGDQITLHPIQYDPGTGVLVNVPLIYTKALFCSNPSSCQQTAQNAVNMAQSGSTFDVLGTIYAPQSIVNFQANAAPVSGQLIADTIQLQGGNGNSGGVAYNGSVVSPVATPPQLIQ